MQLLHLHFRGENPDVGSFGGLQVGEPLGDGDLHDEGQVVGVRLPPQRLQLRPSEGERLRAVKGLREIVTLFVRLKN